MKFSILICIIIISFPSYARDKIDIIVIKKSERTLYAVKNNKVLKKYKIALGRNPIGHKKKEGDKKTPEGYTS